MWEYGLKKFFLESPLMYDVPSHYKGDPFALVRLSPSASAAAAVNYSKWNKNGTCLLADKLDMSSVWCHACRLVHHQNPINLWDRFTTPPSQHYGCVAAAAAVL